ncbi:MAG: AAA family ATPase [Flavobacteriales bacterium]
MIKPFGTCAPLAAGEVFAGVDAQPSAYRFFWTSYSALPSVRSAKRIQGEEFHARAIARYEGRISFLRTMDSVEGPYGVFLESGWWMGMDGVLIAFDADAQELHFLFLATAQSLVSELEDLAKGCKVQHKRSEPFVHVVAASGRGLDIVPIRVNRPRLNISKHYNDDFRDVHAVIRKRLNRNNDKGIVLLHGLPGTGKTTYLRYLIATLKKNVIFIPPGFADRLTDPNFMSLLMQYPNSVLVIEDAERVLADRELEGFSAVSVLLNLSDGLLSDCLNMQLICTFNTHLSRIDQALLRQGRLIARYCFRELEAEKAGALLVAQGKAFEEARPMTLAEVYGDAHPPTKEPLASKDGIGFRVQKAG